MRLVVSHHDISFWKAQTGTSCQPDPLAGAFNLTSAFLVARFVSRDNALVVGLPGCESVIGDPGELVGTGSDGLWRTEFDSHPPIMAAQRRVAMMQGVSREAECFGRTVVDLAGSDPSNLTATDIVVGT
jgi:hypothetical protein